MYYRKIHYPLPSIRWPMLLMETFARCYLLIEASNEYLKKSEIKNLFLRSTHTNMQQIPVSHRNNMSNLYVKDKYIYEQLPQTLQT